jgi:hypothetical protein
MRRSAADRRAEAEVYRSRTEAAQTPPTVSLELCEYDKNRKVLKLASEYMGMPLTFYVRSHKTGKEFRFVPVNPADVLFCPDQWDGEQQIYRPVGHCPTVDHMVIYNQY